MHNSLPAGWRVSNSSGSWAAPAHTSDDEDVGIAAGGLEPDDLRPDSPGWEDMEDDTEPLTIKCLFCEDHTPDFPSFHDHVSVAHHFNFREACREHSLDFYGVVKLINYIRSEVAAGNATPDCTTQGLWHNDKFLKPALDDDALITCLYDTDDLISPDEDASAQPDESEKQ